MIKINDEKLKDLATFYNENGKKEMYLYVRNEFKISNPSELFRRMVKTEKLGYDADKDKFMFEERIHENSVFMSLEELCSPAPIEKRADTIKSQSEEMETLIRNLIENRLLELNKYVTMSPYSKQIIINRSLMIQDGYNILIQ